MGIFQKFYHGLCVSGFCGRKHPAGFFCEFVDIAKRGFPLDHLREFVHQFFVGNGNVSLFIVKKSIDYHGGKDFILGFEFHGCGSVFLYFGLYRVVRYHERDIILHRVCIGPYIIKDLIIWSGTGPIAAWLIIA